MEQGVLEYERVREKKKQLLIKIQETKVGIRHKQNQLQLLEEGLKRIQEQEGSESIGGNLNIFLRDFSVILEALKSDDAFMETKYATQSASLPPPSGQPSTVTQHQPSAAVRASTSRPERYSVQRQSARVSCSQFVQRPPKAVNR